MTQDVVAQQLTLYVVAEATDDYPEQRECLARALEAGLLQVLVVDDPKELAEIAALRQSTGARLGIGECSAIAVAALRHLPIAVDDGVAIKHIKRTVPHLQVHTTQDLMIALVRCGTLSVVQADAIATTWRTHHSFALKITTFADLA